MSTENSIESSKAPEPVGLYPHARRVGNFLFLSGVGPRERGTKKIPGVELDENGNIIRYNEDGEVIETSKEQEDNLLDIIDNKEEE